MLVVVVRATSKRAIAATGSEWKVEFFRMFARQLEAASAEECGRSFANDSAESQKVKILLYNTDG